MAKKTEIKTRSSIKAKTAGKKAASKQSAPSFFDYFRYGESYTSLILGIIVVIITTGLLLGFVHNRNSVNRNVSQLQGSQHVTKISQTDTETVISSVTESPKPTSSPTPKPTVKPTLKPTATPMSKVVATKAPKATATPVPAKKVVVKAKPTIKPAVTPESKKIMLGQGSTYTVKTGDTLWNIAENTYKSGYNWVDIARANNLSNPDDVVIGQKILLPKTEQKSAASEAELGNLKSSDNITGTQADRIATARYTIKAGDTLWNIAVRAYGDGYKWSEISRTNNLSNPDLIYAGASLQLPRK